MQDAITKAVSEFDKTLLHLKEEYAKLQLGRASGALVENLKVEMYGVAQPLKALANISIPDPRTIQIQPWDRSALSAVEKGIVGAGLGLNPVNDGACVRISIPPLTEERRVDLVKHARKLAEDAKISIRNARQDAHTNFKQMKDGGDFTEDDLHDAEENLQDKVNDANNKIEEILKSKEADIMTV